MAISYARLYHQYVTPTHPDAVPLVVRTEVERQRPYVHPARGWTGYISDYGRVTPVQVVNPCWKVTIGPEAPA